MCELPGQSNTKPSSAKPLTNASMQNVLYKLNNPCSCMCCCCGNHDYEFAFCGCRQCKKCKKREYGSGCSPTYLGWQGQGLNVYPAGVLPLCDVTPGSGSVTTQPGTSLTNRPSIGSGGTQSNG